MGHPVKLFLGYGMLHYDYRIIDIPALYEVVVEKEFYLVEENESAAHSNLGGIIHGLVPGSLLHAKHPGVEVHLHLEERGVGRFYQHTAATLFVNYFNRGTQLDIMPELFLLLKSVRQYGVDIRLRASVQNRDFHIVYVYDCIVHTQSRKCRKEMLYGYDAQIPLGNGGAPCRIAHVAGQGLHNGVLRYVDASEYYSAVCRCRIEGDFRHTSRMQSLSLE